MSHRWKSSVRLFAAAGLTLVVAQPMLPTGASADDVRSVKVRAARPVPLKPNLVVLRAADLSLQNGRQHRWVRFESGLGNIGRGPIEVRPNRNRPCPAGQHHATQVMYRDVDGSRFYKRRVDTQVARRSAGCMIFHPRHNHWHFEAAARYRLTRPGQDRAVRVARKKMSFCLRDSRRVPAEYGRFHQPESYGACSKYSPQGISPGWVDVYQSFLAGQALRLPRSARDGLYCLSIRVDPSNTLEESNERDNSSMRAFSLHGDTIRYRRASRCT